MTTTFPPRANRRVANCRDLSEPTKSQIASTPPLVAAIIALRVCGSAGGGDRVRLSRELERDAIDAGYVEPWRHTNARRSSGRKSYRPRPLTHKAPCEAGQILLLPLKPIARLRDFGGGIMPPAVALEVEFRRGQLGLSQQQLVTIIGRSQGQYSNAIRGHDPISGTATNRLRELLLPAAKPHQHDMLGAPVIDLDESA
jgi:hypothetical protein